MIKIKFDRWDFYHKEEALVRLREFARVHGLQGIDLLEKEDEEERKAFFNLTHLVNSETILGSGLPFVAPELREGHDTSSLLARLLSVIEKASGVQAQAAAGPTTVNISIQNDTLLDLEDVDVMEDCCTDQLRTRLQAGWQILAVCNAYKQRRPDYILARVRKVVS